MITARYMILLGGVLVLERKFHAAEELIDRALAITRKNPTPSTLDEGQALFYLGFIKLQQGDLHFAEDTFESVIALDHRHAAVDELYVEYTELGLAQLYSKRGENTRAEQVIRQVLATTKLKPSYVVVAGYALLGHVLLREARLVDAEAALRQPTRGPPMMPPALTQRWLTKTSQRWRDA